MADNEEERESASRGNEWEVVSLTASAYAAAPGPQRVESRQDRHGKLDGELEAETSSAMFMSGHFVFPPSQHENLPLEPNYDQMHNGKGSDDDVSRLAKEERVKSDVKDEDNMSIRGLMSNEFPGIQIFDEKGNALSVSGADLNIYSTAEFSSFHSGKTMDKSNNIEEVEGEGANISIECLNSSSPDLQKPVEGDKYDGADLPCEAWWKRRAVSLYAHAKEANTFWSIFITAAAMGLVIIGHRWQRERWQVLHLKWQIGINDERMGRLLSPISRFKDVIVGGHRRGSLLRGSTFTEH